MSAKKQLLDYFKLHPAEIIPLNTLSEVAGTHSWQRVVRTLRQEGWDIESVKGGYILHSLNQQERNTNRQAISTKLRYQVLLRDNSVCQRCGKTIDDGIKLEIDHKIPVEWGGKTEPDNLWALCNECNGGKKHFFSDFNAEQMKEIMQQSSGSARIKRLFELNPNIELPPHVIAVVAKTREWTRTLRSIREKYQMNIRWIRSTQENPSGAYIYQP